MANIWRKDDSHREQPNRNVIDLSFQNNLTLDFGYLYPVVVQPTIPGDSYEIKPTFALNFESMVFPIQTRMRSYLHFFKVRNRNLWKDWEDFIGKNKQGLEVPYIDESITKARTGELLDYLGVPTTIVGDYGNLEESFSLSYVQEEQSFDESIHIESYATVDGVLSTINSADKVVTTPVNSNSMDSIYLCRYDIDHSKDYSKISSIDTRIGLYEYAGYINDWLTQVFPESQDGTWNNESIDIPYKLPNPISDNICWKYFSLVFSNSSTLTSDSSIASVPAISLGDNGLLRFQFDSSLFESYDYVFLRYAVPVGRYFVETLDKFVKQEPPADFIVTPLRFYSNVIEVRDIDDNNSPYWRSGATTDLRERIKLRALRPRAYEAIYNSFYRNAENNPYKINGVEEYNKYIPSDEGGLDSNKYELHRRNWEDDFLTTALPMPQAGIAPLVGLTGTAGAATVTIANSDGETVVANAQVDEDGNITSLTTDASSNLASSLLDTVTYGISINDLRNVNAFQRWLEAKARGGYKYRDQIETLFGVTVRYDTLDMPEFIGGMSLDVFVNQITQTVNVSPSSPLGDIAGQASCIGSGERITEYCDEHGYIIGILSVVPVPNYSQLLDKDWFKSDAFDYYFPQFGHIGMQPITYKEVCPVQAYQESTESDNVLEDTFGYQRAWYDYLARTDEVHGHFRTTLRDFVMNRTFDVKPELSESFFLVDNEQLNDVFAITDNSVPKIRGQIYFDMKGKRPIPLYGIPKLE